jgi:hypothetical protein
MASSTSRQSRAASKSSTPTANREAVEYIAKLPALLAKDGLTANVEASAWAGRISDSMCFSDYAVLYTFVLATVVRGGCSRKAVTTVTRTSEAPGDSSGLLLCDLAMRRRRPFPFSN